MQYKSTLALKCFFLFFFFLNRSSAITLRNTGDIGDLVIKFVKKFSCEDDSLLEYFNKIHGAIPQNIIFILAARNLKSHKIFSSLSELECVSRFSQKSRLQTMIRISSVHFISSWSRIHSFCRRCLGLSNDLFPSGFLPKICMKFFVSPNTAFKCAALCTLKVSGSNLSSETSCLDWSYVAFFNPSM